MVRGLLLSLVASATAFQVGSPSVVNHRVHCAAPAVTMAIPWRLAGAVGVAGGAAAGVTFAVQNLLKKQAETEATKGRASLSAMGGMDLPSGDLLDKEVEDPFVILGDWKKISTRSGRTRFESISTGKSQWRTPDEMPELEAAAAAAAA